MSTRTVAGLWAVAFVIWFTLGQPANAGHIVHNIGSFLASAADGFASFVSRI